MSFQIIRNDITKMRVSAIVNPTNRFYIAKGGTDLQVHLAAGEQLDKELERMPPCPVGNAVITKGYNLDADFVIHTVGPVWIDGDHSEREMLRKCYRNSLRIAKEHKLNSIAFPLIASGTFRFPKADAVEIAVSEIRSFLETNEMTVYLVVYDKEALRVSNERYGKIKDFIEQRLPNRFESLPQMDAELPPISEKREPSLHVVDEDSGVYGISEPHTQQIPQALQELLKMKDESFSQALIRMIDERGMTDAQCYKRANVDKQLFNKVKNKKDYKPRKTTVLALIFALKPTREEMTDLLSKAGYTLSNNNEFDIIINYCFDNGIIDVISINQILFQFDQVLLGSEVR